MSKILLIGLGPHSKRIYIKGLQRLGLSPSVIVDLESKEQEVVQYVNEQGLQAKLLFIPDREKDALQLSCRTCKALDQIISESKITNAIISTEPKSHYSYLKYLIIRGIPTLTDKPITAPINVANDESAAEKISSEFRDLLSLIKKFQTKVVVQCQRRYDLRYKWIIQQIQKLVNEYAIPVSHVNITHCDGSLNMPDEFFSRENHPYKYGYGKLFHSGYHFIDLLTMLLSYELLPEEKRPIQCFLSSALYTPHDQLFSLDETFYEQIFGKNEYHTFYQRWEQMDYKRMGELDLLALLEFTRGSEVITTCSLNLLQSGYSRRAWPNLPKNTYKGNGRVRHESISLHLGPLMNIQVHSYQAHEIKERNNTMINHSETGGLEHFDIHVFRNSEIIGGSPFELIKGCDIYGTELESQSYFAGYNENARDECLKDFIFGSGNGSTLEDQLLTIELLENIYLSACRKRRGEPPISKFVLTNEKNKTTKDYNNDKTELCRSLSC